MKKNAILILFAHPSQHRSESNKPMFAAANALDFVTCVDLYGEYPQANIDIDKEQQRLIAHDIIIFQFPLYWYSTPPLLKEWQDLVLEYGFAYGHDGHALHGKSFMCAITAGGSEEAYCQSGYNYFSIRELLCPLEQTASLTGMTYIPPFTLFSSRTAREDNRLDCHLQRWQKLLHALHHNQLDLRATNKLEKINQAIATLPNPLADKE